MYLQLEPCPDLCRLENLQQWHRYFFFFGSLGAVPNQPSKFTGQLGDAAVSMTGRVRCWLAHAATRN